LNSGSKLVNLPYPVKVFSSPADNIDERKRVEEVKKTKNPITG